MIFGTSAQTIKRLKYKLKCHDVKTTGHTHLLHIHHSTECGKFVSLINFFFVCKGELRNALRTCTPQLDRAKPKPCFCAAPAPSCCPTFKSCSHIFLLFFFLFVCFGTMRSTCVITTNLYLPHKAAAFITTAHSVSWKRDNSRLIGFTSHRAELLQMSLKQGGFLIN